MSKKLKRLFKFLIILLIFTIPILYFLFTTIFFSPFEDPFGRIEAVIPREVDVFFRKAGLKGDFYDFPIPSFYSERLVYDRDWQDFTQTPCFEDITADIDFDQLLEGIRAQYRDIPFFDPLEDLLGQEVAVVGNFKRGGELPVSYLVFLKGSWKVKMAFELFTWNWCREMFMSDIQVSGTFANPEGYITLVMEDDREFYIKRAADLIIAGDDEELMQEVCTLISAGGAALDSSLAGRHAFIEKVAAVDRRDSEYFDFHARVDRILQRETFDDDWKENKVDFSVMTAVEIFDPEFFKAITGALRFGRFLDLSAKVDFYTENVAKAETGFFGLDSVSIAEKFDFFTSMLPSDTFLAGCAKLDLEPILKIMNENLHPDMRKFIDDLVREAQRWNRQWKVRSVWDFIGKLDATFGDMVYIALRPRVKDKPLIPGVQPIPIIALVLEIKNMESFKAIEKTVIDMQNNRSMPFEVWKYTTEIYNCTIKGINTPGADDIDQVVYTVFEDRYFIMTTSDDFIEEMLRAKFNPDLSLKKSRVYQPTAEFIDGYGNFAAYLEMKGLKGALWNYAVYWAEIHPSIAMDMVAKRQEVRTRIIRTEFPRHRGDKELPATVEQKVEDRVEAEMNEMRKHRREKEVPRLAEKYRKKLAWIDLLQSLSLQVNVNLNDLDLNVRASTVLSK